MFSSRERYRQTKTVELTRGEKKLELENKYRGEAHTECGFQTERVDF